MTYKDLDLDSKKKYYSLLCDIITDNRRLMLENIVEKRTKYFVPVIENIHKSQNASAVLRTCDCLGVQDVRIVENSNKFSVTDDISLGANKWLNIHKYNSFEDNTKQCFEDLRKEGYKVVVTMPHDRDINLQEVDINQKTAIVFGSEVDGVSQSAIDNADCFMKIPMYGFTESFNISVSVAIVFHYLTDKLRHSNIAWQLNEEEKLDTLIGWALQSITSKDKIAKELLSRVREMK